jgi:HEAT repeat protein
MAKRIIDAILADKENIDFWPAYMEELSQLGPRVSEYLGEILRGESRGNIKVICAKVIGRIKDQKRIPDLINGLHDTSDEVRVSCIRALSSFKFKSILSDLLKMMDDNSALVRKTAVIELSEFDEPLVKLKIQERLKDQDIFVRKWAALTLSRYSEPDTVPVLIDLIRNGDQSYLILRALREVTKRKVEIESEIHHISSNPEIAEKGNAMNLKIAEEWLDWWEKEGKYIYR